MFKAQTLKHDVTCSKFGTQLSGLLTIQKARERERERMERVKEKEGECG
jgi:hypothetical protein